MFFQSTEHAIEVMGDDFFEDKTDLPHHEFLIDWIRLFGRLDVPHRHID